MSPFVILIDCFISARVCQMRKVGLLLMFVAGADVDADHVLHPSLPVHADDHQHPRLLWTTSELSHFKYSLSPFIKQLSSG